MGFLFRKKKIEGKTAEEWFELGLKEKDPKKKIEYFSKCVELDPDPKDAYAWGRKGFALEMLGRYEEAIRCYDKALKIDPKYADARIGKGIALVLLGRYEEAIRCFDKALEIDPEYEEARNNKKLAEEKLKGYYRAKIEQWKSEGYNVSELEEMLE